LINLNDTSITVPNLKGSIIVKDFVGLLGIYEASIRTLAGISVLVNPDTLKFKEI
ncbi:subtilisin-like protease, partial [Olea europaea subsp. europaea]